MRPSRGLHRCSRTRRAHLGRFEAFEGCASRRLRACDHGSGRSRLCPLRPVRHSPRGRRRPVVAPGVPSSALGRHWGSIAGRERLVGFETPPLLPWPASLPAGTAIASLTIPAAGVTNYAVVQGIGELQLESAPGHYPSSPLPGQPGNVAIAGHRTTWGAPFFNLQAATPNSAITLRVDDVVYHYRVTRTFVVAPNDGKVIAAIRGWWLTSTTCDPRYSASRRAGKTRLERSLRSGEHTASNQAVASSRDAY